MIGSNIISCILCKSENDVVQIYNSPLSFKYFDACFIALQIISAPVSSAVGTPLGNQSVNFATFLLTPDTSQQITS